MQVCLARQTSNIVVLLTCSAEQAEQSQSAAQHGGHGAQVAKELVMVKIVSRCSSKPWSHHIIYVQGAPCPLAGLHSLCIKGMEVLARKRNFDPCNAKA